MMPQQLPTTASSDMAEICGALYKIAQKHTPSSAFGDVNELLHVAKILKSCGVELAVAPKLQAAVSDHIPAVARQSADYRLLRARFFAALSTIADMGQKTSKTHKSEFHGGVQEGLRQAAKTAIMFLNDLDESAENFKQACRHKKPDSPIVR
jgi:hypothetical protein